jgi:hypothetical protein
MQDRAAIQNSGATGKFSTLDWPTPELLRAAHRARGKALRDMALALGSLLKRKITRPIFVAGGQREMTNRGRSPVADG